MMMHLFELLFSHASFKGPGIMKVEGPLICEVPVTIAMIYGAVASVVWLHRDAVQRHKNGWLAILFTGWPLSFLWWFWLRPPMSLPLSDRNQNTP